MRLAVTGRDGSAQVELPMGRVVVAVDPGQLQEAWIGLDQEVELVFEC